MLTSLKQLEQVKVSKAEVSVLTTDVKNTQMSLMTLGSNAPGQWTTQISGLKTALSQLHSKVTTLASNPSVTAVASVTAAVGAVKTAGTAFVDTAKANCPNIGG